MLGLTGFFVLLGLGIVGVAVHKDSHFSETGVSDNENDTLNLRVASKGLGVYMGTSLKAPDLVKDSYYAKFAPVHYDLATPENCCKMVSIARKGINKSDWNYSTCE